ncbi:MAG: BamA/TamA family outer membrane protein [Bacteroidetes bacterium]|nr:BamA/TamA family outer membrane protein [Bacteroidota bacterium]
MIKKYYYILFLALSIPIFGQSLRKLEVTQIKFLGNTAISSSTLSTVIYSKESPSWFSQFLGKFSSLGNKPVYFDSLLIPLDLKAIKELYRSKGYFKTSVSEKTITDNSSGEVTLIYSIDESSPAYIKSFAVNGLDTIAPEYQVLLHDYAKVDTTTIYDDALVDEKKNYIITFLRDHGFMLSKVDKPIVTVDTLKNKVDVKLQFTSGRRYKVGEISTTRTGVGFDLVHDDLLKELVGIKTGQWYSNYDIQRGTVRLFRTNLFTAANIMAVTADTVGNVVPIRILADIGTMNELSPEIIMNNEENTFNLGLGLNFIRKNFLGDARKFTIGTSAAAQNISEFFHNPSFADSAFYGYFDARVSVEQPFIFGRPIGTKLETYFTAQKQKDKYNSNIFGAKLSFDFELPQFTYITSFNAYFNIERSEYTYKPIYLKNLLSLFLQRNNYPKAVADSLAANSVNSEPGGQMISQSTNAALGINVGANKTNDTFFPTSGYSLSLLIEDGNAIPYLISRIIKTDFTRPLFFKTVFTSTLYLPFYSSTVNSFGLKFKVGQIFTYRGDKADIPLNQRLYAGGSNSVRGWASRQLVPSVSEFSLGANPTQEDLVAILQKGAATGGFFLLEGSIETRNRLVGKVGSALFIDYGNTWNGYKEFRFDQVAVAAGFGIRYYSEYVPLRIDFGFKVYDPNDRRSMFKKSFWSELLQFHLGIGEAF